MFEDLSPKLDPKKIGAQYLSELRKMHSQKTPRKRESQSSALASGEKSAAATASAAGSDTEKKDYIR